MIFSDTRLDRFQPFVWAFLAGYAACSVVDKVPELRTQVAVEQKQVVKAKSEAGWAKVQAGRAECERKIMLAVIASYNGVEYKAPACPPEIRAQVLSDLTKVQW